MIQESSHTSQKIQPIGSSVDNIEMESTNSQISNSNEVEMESTDLQILNSSGIETNHPMLNFDVIDGNKNNNYESEDDDIELQQILFYSAQFHSGKNLKSSSDGQKVVEMKYPIIYGSINLENSIHEKGESSCTFCEICEDVFSLPNTLMQGTNCHHYYCVVCIQNYIGKKINKDINELVIKCPVSNCDGILDLASIMPSNYLIRVENAFQEIQALASPIIVDCPFMDCIGTLMDDKKGYLIRACPKCWRIFCVKCRDLHLGMTCEEYEYSRQLDFLYWRQFGGYQDEQEQQQQEEEMEQEEKQEKEEDYEYSRQLDSLYWQQFGGYQDEQEQQQEEEEEEEGGTP